MVALLVVITFAAAVVVDHMLYRRPAVTLPSVEEHTQTVYRATAA
jgi:hypothetical protein